MDSTHRHVWANRYRSEAAVRGGAAASMAEADKWKRYGDGSDGVVVTTAAVERWGYFGEGLEWLLDSLVARKAAVSRLSVAGAVAIGRRWRQELGAAQVRAFHATLVQATKAAKVEDEFVDADTAAADDET